MSRASAASAKPSAGVFKSPTTFWTWKNSPSLSARPREKISPSRKPPIPRSTDCSAPTKLRMISPARPSRSSLPIAKAQLACAKSPSIWLFAEPSRSSRAMTAKSTSMRLDALLVERGLADSIAKAQAMILAGEVSVDAARADKAGTVFPSQVQIEISSRAGKFVSRGGLKLEGALEDFAIDPNARVCMDVGASTGGFTDCLLQHGAARVYAVDVNLDQLAWKLRKDPRVLRVIRNARDLRAGDTP